MEEMQPEEGFALREWRRENAIRLEEKEVLSHIIDEADEYKVVDFYSWRKVACETNREKEKLFVASQEKFHAEVDKNYWKTIEELIPNEVPAIERRKREKKMTSIVVIQGLLLDYWIVVNLLHHLLFVDIMVGWDRLL